MTRSPLVRQLLPFLVLQSSLSTLVGFAAVFAYAQGGLSLTVQAVLSFLTATMVGIVGPLVIGTRRPVRLETVVRWAFAVPALVLPWADGHPWLLGAALGGYLGLSWSARQWIELHLIPDAQRDRYAAHVTVFGVLATLATTLVVSLLLNAGASTQRLALMFYALIGAVGWALAARDLPQTPAMRLEAPVEVLRQPGYRASLPLYLLESGLFGVGLVVGANGAIEALGTAGHYGWVATAATLVGAAGLYALRHRRHARNRDRSMAYACVGVVAAQTLLGASAWWPALYVLHLLTQAAAAPFWQASEQVLNQRALDLRGAVADRIVVREVTLWLMRCTMLLGFWWVVQDQAAVTVLSLGAGLMAAASWLEYRVGRAWLQRHPEA